MPIYLTENDSPNFRKISNIILPTGGIEGGQFASKRICKVYICTNTDPLEFKLVYNGCDTECPCLCSWCTDPTNAFEIQCQYHTFQIGIEQKSPAVFLDCGCSDNGNYYDLGEGDTFTPGCYYNAGSGCAPGLQTELCYKRCCDALPTNCEAFPITHLSSCCALRNDPNNPGNLCIDNNDLYSTCNGDITTFCGEI